MATAQGFVNRFEIGVNICITLRTDSTSEVFFINFRASDSPAQLRAKKAAFATILRATFFGYSVTLTHADDSAELAEIQLGRLPLCAVGEAIHGDFYGVTASGFPGDANIWFRSATANIEIAPDLRRPHWLMIAELPASIPLGRNYVRAAGAGFSTPEVPVEVFAGRRRIKRTLYSGIDKPVPYAIVFVANVGIINESGVMYRDPILTDRAGFHNIVSYCLNNTLTSTEDILRAEDRERQIRIVSIFSEFHNEDDGSSLIQEVNPDILSPRGFRYSGFVLNFLEYGDVIYAITGSATHTRASAQFSEDLPARGEVDYLYDGATRKHGYVSHPGTIAINVSNATTRMTALHEYLHAASDYKNGSIVDLYNDASDFGGVFNVNKKFRTNSTDPVPTNFATHRPSDSTAASTQYASAPSRGGDPYDAGWRSYHPEQIDPANRNLMDDYTLSATPADSRLDKLTYAWLGDRLRVKFRR